MTMDAMDSAKLMPRILAVLGIEPTPDATLERVVLICDMSLIPEITVCESCGVRRFILPVTGGSARGLAQLIDEALGFPRGSMVRELRLVMERGHAVRTYVERVTHEYEWLALSRVLPKAQPTI